MVRAFVSYWIDMLRESLSGSARYFAWLTFLTAIVVSGLLAYLVQLDRGLVVSNMSNQVSWGAYIANFTFLVGVAAAAVLLVVPAYAFGRGDIKKVVLIGELLAVSAICMCLMFVTVDLGHPERFLHLLPFIGKLNLPGSILAWDVVVLNGYLFLNLHIPGYLLFKRYRGQTPSHMLYVPFVFLSMFWAVSIHTVTAFLYSGLGSRPFWNTAILAPRFLLSAFAGGPAILIIVFLALRRYAKADVPQSAIKFLTQVVMVTLPVNLFLFGAEVFTEMYTDTKHTAAMRYVFFGLHGHAKIAPYAWASLFMSLFALTVFLHPRLRERTALLVLGSFALVVGIWIEKGMGLIIPGFLPSPLGDLVEYTPSLVETLVCAGIWAAGGLIFTLMVKAALAIQRGDLRYPD
jgi:molybdopterin-containing oxidoreductase family membrane subunit